MIETEFAGECVILGVKCVVSYDTCEMRITEAPGNGDKDELTCSKARDVVALLEGNTVRTSDPIPSVTAALQSQRDELEALIGANEAVIDALDCATTGLSPIEAIDKLKELALGRTAIKDTEIDATDLDLDVRGNQFVLRMGSAKRMFSPEVSKALAETLLASRKGSEPVQDPEPTPVAQKLVTVPSVARDGAPRTADWVSGESEEQEDESEDGESDENEIDVPQEIKDTKKLATVLAWLRQGGLEDVEKIVARCGALKPHVPYIARIKEEDLRGRVERTLAVMDG